MIPDLSFAVIRLAAAEDRTAIEWSLSGNGKAGPIVLLGTDFIESAGNHIQSIHRYFDYYSLSSQLGGAAGH
jgi:hypothetical protein